MYRTVNILSSPSDIPNIPWKLHKVPSHPSKQKGITDINSFNPSASPRKDIAASSHRRRQPPPSFPYYNLGIFPLSAVFGLASVCSRKKPWFPKEKVVMISTRSLKSLRFDIARIGNGIPWIRYATLPALLTAWLVVIIIIQTANAC